MNRIDVHCHFLPCLDDGCASLEDSLTCLRTMANAGYNRVFCTPHCGQFALKDPCCEKVDELVKTLAGHLQTANIPIELKPGGELRLTPHLAEDLLRLGVPTYGHAGKYVLADSWDEDWPFWATKAVEWLQKRNYTVILAHPERMPVLLENPDKIDELASLGVLFQGNLGPIGGGESPKVNALARRYLLEGRYFMVGTDGHRPAHMAPRINGLKVIEELLGKDKLDELTVRNPARLWG
jgi:protein-tyrosine phosphatase